MFNWPFKTEHFRHLQRGEQRPLFDHLQRLSENEQFDRFLTYVDSSDLIAHVNRDWPEHETIGWFSKGVLRGAIEIFYGDNEAEAGLTVEPQWRGQGIGTELVTRALSRARSRGMASLMIPGHNGNYPLLAIAARFGAMQAALRDHVVKGLPPIEDSRAMGFHFDLQETAAAEQPGRLRRAFSPLLF